MKELEILICRSTNVFRTIWKISNNDVERILLDFREKTKLDSFDLLTLKKFILETYEVQNMINVFDCEIQAEETGSFKKINPIQIVWFVDFNITG